MPEEKGVFVTFSWGKDIMIAIAQPQPGTDEQEAVRRGLASDQLVQGRHIADFERRFAEVCHVSIHQQPYFQDQIDKCRCTGLPGRANAKRGSDNVRLPVPEVAAQQVLSLPVHPQLSWEDLRAIVREVHALCN